MTYSEYVSVTLVIQRAMHMHVASPALPHFSTLPHTCRNIWKNVHEHEVCVLIFCTTFV